MTADLETQLKCVEYVGCSDNESFQVASPSVMYCESHITFMHTTCYLFVILTSSDLVALDPGLSHNAPSDLPSSMSVIPPMTTYWFALLVQLDFDFCTFCQAHFAQRVHGMVGTKGSGLDPDLCNFLSSRSKKSFATCIQYTCQIACARSINREF